MSQMKQEDKDKRRQTRLATKQRHKNLQVKTFEVKIDSSHLSNSKYEHLRLLFLEAKWFYNAMVASTDIFKFNPITKEVMARNKDKVMEKRELTHLTAQMKQDLHGKIISSIKGLSTKKKKGFKVGRLKFKSRIWSH